MVYFGDDIEGTDLFKIHEELARSDDRINFAHADVKCAEQFEANLTEGLVFFKPEDDTSTQYTGANDKASIEAFIKEELKSLVYDFSEENKDIIFKEG